MRKPAFCIHPLPKSEISGIKTSSVAVHPDLCGTWSETPKTGFLTTRLIFGDPSRSSGDKTFLMFISNKSHAHLS